MQRNSCHPRSVAQSRPGFTLLESTISGVLVGIMMVAALQALGASRRRETSTVDRVLAQQLAGSLINEVMLQVYQEPNSSQTPVFGPEPGEASGQRSLFDDVDDYAGWTSSPPTDRNGTVVPGFVGWTQTATVQWADPNTLAVTANSFTGLKRITVTVTKGGQTIASLESYRSVAWVDTIPKPTDATGNQGPVAVATSPELSRQVNSAVTFDASSSTDPDGDSLSYVWQFGDGSNGAGKIVTKDYMTEGNYTCVLTVYDGRGGSGTAALTALIYR